MDFEKKNPIRVDDVYFGLSLDGDTFGFDARKLRLVNKSSKRHHFTVPGFFFFHKYWKN